jgi:hypothetical protein
LGAKKGIQPQPVLWSKFDCLDLNICLYSCKEGRFPKLSDILLNPKYRFKVKARLVDLGRNGKGFNTGLGNGWAETVLSTSPNRFHLFIL